VNAATATAWLQALGEAWTGRDVDAFTALFADTADYYWTPFEAPKRGRAEIGAAFSNAVETQRDIRFGFELLHAGAEFCVAHWWCGFRRTGTNAAVQIDGIMQVWLDRDGKCVEFREWWRKDEAPEAVS